MKKTKIIPFIIGGLILYLASSGISYAAFRYLNGKPLTDSTATTTGTADDNRSKLDLSTPKTEACPVNGQKYTSAERQIWETRRPIAVMIENHEDSRPQSGLSKADVVYEAVAEGGITRFLAIYYCGASAQEVKLAPVRSARVYFIHWASEYGENPLYVHVGGANNLQNTGTTAKEARAIELLSEIGWRYRGGNDFDATFDLGYPVFVRDESRLDHPVAVEHTMTSSTDKIWAEATKRGLTAKDSNLWGSDSRAWKFKEDASSSERGTVASVGFSFFGDFDDYKVVWKYDKDNNLYRRENGGVAHLDLNTNEQLAAKNVVVLFMKEKASVDANKHFLYTTTGKGEALVFVDGQVIKGSWAKEAREERTILTDSKGKEIEFNRGPIWFEIVATGKTVEY